VAAVRGDEHGTPALVADHLLSLSGSGNAPDALDFYGPWKLLDARSAARPRGRTALRSAGPPGSASWAGGAMASR